MRWDLGSEQFDVYRLGQVVVAPCFQAGQHVFLFYFAGEENDGDPAFIEALANATGGFQAIHLRHDDIHQDQVGQQVFAAGQCLGTIFCGNNLVT